jgi:hypothetical protein
MCALALHWQELLRHIFLQGLPIARLRTHTGMWECLPQWQQAGHGYHGQAEAWRIYLVQSDTEWIIGRIPCLKLLRTKLNFGGELETTEIPMP